MKIQIIGADAAFDGLNTSLYFKDDLGRGVLVDCGYTVYPELNRRGLRGEVDIVLVSHTHGDHAGSLTKLAAYQYYNMNGKTIMVAGHEWLPELFNIMGVEPTKQYQPLSENDPLNLKIIRTKHIAGHGHNNALFIADTILYSGDCVDNLLLTDWARKAKIIFHDTTLSAASAKSHASLDSLAAAPDDIKAKTWLIHLPVHAHEEAVRLAAENGFAGVCHNGQEIII